MFENLFLKCVVDVDVFVDNLCMYVFFFVGYLLVCEVFLNCFVFWKVGGIQLWVDLRVNFEVCYELYGCMGVFCFVRCLFVVDFNWCV